jgi:predicted TIM-barrel fold metal-dependent hydrolase
MAQLDFQIFDADNHYYEATDAFTRHIEPAFARRCMQWAVIDGKKRLLVGGKINRFIPNPLFDPVARPGCLDEYYRGRNKAGADVREIFGRLDPIHPSYRDRDARLKVMDRQGMERCFLFPTLGVGMEEALAHDPEACHAAFRAFNRWLEDDWGYHYRDRLYAAPYLTLALPDQAVAELERLLALDVRVICMRAGPVACPDRPRSPADPCFDGFWARVNEAGMTVACHGGDSGYNRYAEDWGEGGELEAFKASPFKTVLGSRPAYDMMAALVCQRLFQRFPNLRVASIEMGSNWVPPLMAGFRRAFGQIPQSFAEDPVETFRRHIWVSPFHEDDVPGLKQLVGADRMLMGSDWPHAEGIAEPTDYVKELVGFSDREIRQVMHDNALALSQRRPASAA